MADFIDLELNAHFFSNDNIVLGKESLERTISPANVRPDPTREFETPTHTIGSKSLLIFLDGKLQAFGIDYIDKDSNHVEFKNRIETGVHYEAILIAKTGMSGVGFAEWEEF